MNLSSTRTTTQCLHFIVCSNLIFKPFAAIGLTDLVDIHYRIISNFFRINEN